MHEHGKDSGTLLVPTACHYGDPAGSVVVVVPTPGTVSVIVYGSGMGDIPFVMPIGRKPHP